MCCVEVGNVYSSRKDYSCIGQVGDVLGRGGSLSAAELGTSTSRTWSARDVEGVDFEQKIKKTGTDGALHLWTCTVAIDVPTFLDSRRAVYIHSTVYVLCTCVVYHVQ